MADQYQPQPMPQPRYLGPATVINNNGDVAYHGPNGELTHTDEIRHMLSQDAQGNYHVYEKPHVTLIPIDHDPFTAIHISELQPTAGTFRRTT
jgi:hypothetical protein